MGHKVTMPLEFPIMSWVLSGPPPLVGLATAVYNIM